MKYSGLTSWLNELSPQAKTTADCEAFQNSVFGIEKKPFPYLLCVTNMFLHGLESPNIRRDNSLAKHTHDILEKDKFEVILMNPPYGGHELENVRSKFPPAFAGSETADLFMSVIMDNLKSRGRAAVVLPDGFLFGTDNVKVAIKKKLLNTFNLHTVIRLPHSVFAPYTSITTNILFFNLETPGSGTWFYRLDMPEGYKHFSKTKPMLLKHFDPVIEWWNDRKGIKVDGFDKARYYSSQELRDRDYDFDLCGFPRKDEEIPPPADLIFEYRERCTELQGEMNRALEKISKLLGLDPESEQ